MELNRSTKQEFINRLNKIIEYRNILLSFYENVYLPTLALNFDNKVYNIRFIKALRKEADKMSENQVYTISVGELHYNHVEIRIYYAKFSYTQYEDIYCPCITNENNRLSYEKTINDKFGIKVIENFKKYTEDIKNTIKRYDDYMKVAEALKECIDSYNALPHIFRENIEKNQLFIF